MARQKLSREGERNVWYFVIVSVAFLSAITNNYAKNFFPNDLIIILLAIVGIVVTTIYYKK